MQTSLDKGPDLTLSPFSSKLNPSKLGSILAPPYFCPSTCCFSPLAQFSTGPAPYSQGEIQANPLKATIYEASSMSAASGHETNGNWEE